MSSLAQGFRLILPFLLCALILGIVAPSTALVAHAQSATDIQAQIDAHNQKIKDLDAEIATYQKQLDVLGGQKQTLQSAIKSIDISRQQTTTQVQVTQNKIGATDLQLSQIRQDISTKQGLIDLDRATVAKSLRSLQTATESSAIEQIFAADTLTAAWTDIDRTTSLNDVLQTQVQTLSGVKVQLSNQEDVAAATRTKLASLQKDLVTQQQALDANKAAKASLLTQTKNQEGSYQKLIASKRAEEATFEAALYQLSLQLKAADPSKVPSASKGVLAYPLANINITQLFGKTTDSGRLYASGTHNGVDFGTPIGTPVMAALSGTVQETNEGAVQNCQYGKWVLIKHANGLSTLYAHLSQIQVTKGQEVTTGQTIAFSGMTGYATGPHLHLTVYNSSAVTFKQYACKSGPTVYIPIAPPNGYLDPMAYL
jgi:murein DD-endopeptidase MepM/ murein hydrolase activator NlpD